MAGRRIGGLWKSTNEQSAAVLNGTIDICGVPIRISVCRNTDDNRNENAPPYHIVSYGLDRKAIPQDRDSGQDTGGF